MERREPNAGQGDVLATLVPFPGLERARDRLSLPPLPVPLTSFLGRTADVTGVSDLVRKPEVRLVTLTGAAGVGKTRLAIEVAAQVRGDFADGVGFVPFAEVADPDGFGAALARALRLDGTGGRSPLEALISLLQDRDLLLVLDSFERLVTVAPTVASLLAACEHLKVLVTSTRRLHVRGEREVEVEPLPLPPRAQSVPTETLGNNPSVELFAQRASAVSPGFSLDGETAHAVAEICRRLDGLPLAIELAAARSRLLPPKVMLARLDRRLPILTGGPRDLPRRQQTLRGAIAWTYDLLSPEDQALFRQLSVFGGDFSLTAAEAVAGGQANEILPPSVLDGIESLVDKHLLRVMHSGETAEERFGFLETVREFGLDQLAADPRADETYDRLADWCLKLVEEANGHFESLTRGAWFDRLDREFSTIRTAVEWLYRQRDVGRGLRLGRLLGWYMVQRYHLAEGGRWLEQFLALPESRSVPEERAGALDEAGGLAYWRTDFPRATELFGEALAAYHDLGDERGIAAASQQLANCAFDSGDIDRAEQLIRESVESFARLGDRSGTAVATGLLARLVLARDDVDRSRALYEEARDIFRAIDNSGWATYMTESLGFAHLVARDDAAAREAYREALSVARSMSDEWRIASCLLGFAELARRKEQPRRAGRLFAAAAAAREALAITLRPSTQAIHDAWISAVREVLGETAFAAVTAQGRQLPLGEAIEVALRDTEDESQPADAAPTVDETLTARFAGLSPRELEVLRLIAEGCTNREIGDRLYISHRTVMQHVASILGKLDVGSRTAAAALAHRHGFA
jgi:predicted ATPase/DNA-binding CsgD family transcriptional regulator